MSNQSPFGGRRQALFPTMPKGEVVATYETYNEAQGAVDRLAKADFPVKQLSIVGNDLKSVERVTGKLTWGRVALAGAASGAWLGVFFGLLFFIFSPAGAGLPFLFAAVLIGAGFGMLFGLVSYAVNRRRRDFTSTMQVIATNYQVMVESGLVNRARNVLAGQGEEAGAAHAHAETRHGGGHRHGDGDGQGSGTVPVEPSPAPGEAPRPPDESHDGLGHHAGPSAPVEDPTPSDVPVGTRPPEEPPAYGERPPQEPPAYGERPPQP